VIEAQSVHAFVLAGGQSRRMGRDKALLEIGGRTMLERACALVREVAAESYIVGVPQLHHVEGFTTIPDEAPGLGPLGGIVTALARSNREWNLVLACDMPYVTTEWLEYLESRAARSAAHAVLPVSPKGPEPLCAMYRITALEEIRRAIGNGVLKVTRALEELSVEWLPRNDWEGFDADGCLFKNMNMPADYQEALVRLEGKRSQ
jgi:molybdopterin-guanine dinucleotide biosynthesis protein A